MLGEFIGGLEKMTAAVTNLVGTVEKNVKSGYEISDMVKGRRQLEKWTSVLEMLQQMQSIQTDVPGTIRHLAARLSDDAKKNIEASKTLREMLSRVADNADRIKKFLQEFHGDLIFENHQLYDDLIRSLSARTEFADTFNRTNLTFDRASTSELKRIADLYENLFDTMRDHRMSLAKFVSERARTTGKRA